MADLRTPLTDALAAEGTAAEVLATARRTRIAALDAANAQRFGVTHQVPLSNERCDRETAEILASGGMVNVLRPGAVSGKGYVDYVERKAVKWPGVGSHDGYSTDADWEAVQVAAVRDGGARQVTAASVLTKLTAEVIAAGVPNA